jgi:hypothetical protein
VVAIGISLMFDLCTLLDANPMTNQHVLLPAASSGFSSRNPAQDTYVCSSIILQRITEDVEKFSSAVSELFSYTFKPVLDIILFTRSLSKTIG